MCFIDGFNLYHAIDDLHLNHLKWVNLSSLAEAFIKPSQETLTATFYFTAYATWRKASCQRHQTYIRALEEFNVTPIIGHFKEKEKRCKACATTWISHEEKQSDVNLAIHLLHQAHVDGFDKALVVTADSDMCSAIDLVIDNFGNKELIILTPPNRYAIAREIRARVQTLKIKRKHLERNLLPQIIPSKHGLIEQPKEYRLTKQ